LKGFSLIALDVVTVTVFIFRVSSMKMSCADISVFTIVHKTKTSRIILIQGYRNKKIQNDLFRLIAFFPESVITKNFLAGLLTHPY
jgi:hypothetical protein